MAKQVLRRKIPITAVHIDDLGGILEKLKLHDSVVNGKAKCYFCNKPINLENIGGILSVNEETVLVCDKPECLIKAAILSAELRASGSGNDQH